MAGPALALVYLICGILSFFILRALGALSIVTLMNLIDVKWFAEMELCFALIKAAAIATFLMVGTVYLSSGNPLDGNTPGLHLITDNDGLFPHGILPALVLVQGGNYCLTRYYLFLGVHHSVSDEVA